MDKELSYYTEAIYNAIYDWIDMSGDPKAQSNAMKVLSKLNLPSKLKSDNSTLFRIQTVEKEKIKDFLSGKSIIKTREFCSWSHTKKIKELLGQDFFDFDAEKEVVVLFTGSFSNTIVDLRSYYLLGTDESKEFLEDFEHEIFEEQEVIVKQNTLTKENVLEIFDEDVSQYGWTPLKKYLKLIK